MVMVSYCGYLVILWLSGYIAIHLITDIITTTVDQPALQDQSSIFRSGSMVPTITRS